MSREVAANEPGRGPSALKRPRRAAAARAPSAKRAHGCQGAPPPRSASERAASEAPRTARFTQRAAPEAPAAQSLGEPPSVPRQLPRPLLARRCVAPRCAASPCAALRGATPTRASRPIATSRPPGWRSGGRERDEMPGASHRLAQRRARARRDARRISRCSREASRCYARGAAGRPLRGAALARRNAQRRHGRCGCAHARALQRTQRRASSTAQRTQRRAPGRHARRLQRMQRRAPRRHARAGSRGCHATRPCAGCRLQRMPCDSPVRRVPAPAPEDAMRLARAQGAGTGASRRTPRAARTQTSRAHEQPS